MVEDGGREAVERYEIGDFARSFNYPRIHHLFTRHEEMLHFLRAVDLSQLELCEVLVQKIPDGLYILLLHLSDACD